MRILVLSNSDSGLYQFRKELIHDLSLTHEVICSVPNEDGYIEMLEQEGCKCIITDFERHGINPFREFLLILKYRKLITNLEPNVVLTYTIKPNVYGGIACKCTKKPLISNITGLGDSIENGGLIGRISLRLYKIALKGARCVFFQNKNNLKLFQAKGIVNKNARLIPGSGVNLDEHFLEPYPGDEDGFRFLFVGRVTKDKGIEELLSAIEQLSKEDKSIILDIVGKYDESEYANRIQKLESLGMVKYYGHQADVHKYYKNAHCVVLPSYHEGMANVLLEGASTGRPVIATDIPGCRETFEDGNTGIKCTPKSTDSLFVAMKKMTNMSWDDRKKMGLAGRAKIESEFSRSIIVKAYRDEIDSLLQL